MKFNFRREKICVLHVENRRQTSTEYGIALQTFTGLAEVHYYFKHWIPCSC